MMLCGSLSLSVAQCNKARANQCCSSSADNVSDSPAALPLPPPPQTVRHDRGITAARLLTHESSLWDSGVLLLSAAFQPARVWLFGLEGGLCLDFSSSSLQPLFWLPASMTPLQWPVLSLKEAVCQEDKQEWRIRAQASWFQIESR